MELEAEYFRKAGASLGNYESQRETAALLLDLAHSCSQPFNLAVVGRMKTGKSTLINALIGKRLTISDVEEATATLNWISHGSADQKGQFLVQWKDGRSEPHPLTDLSLWSGKTPEVIERIKRTAFLRMFDDAEYLRQIQIVDTPGTGSAVEEHEIAGGYLDPTKIEESIREGGKADAIIYVFPPVGREKDKEALVSFASGRLPNSDPYNSVAVLHKWDALSAENPRELAQEKARLLFEKHLRGTVANVIPVSAPLALAARTAPDPFFIQLVSCIIEDREGTEKALQMSDRWDSDPEKKSLRALHEMPWASFRLLARGLIRERVTEEKSARHFCLRESGITALEDFLNKEFFSQTAIIKKCQLLQRASTLLEPALHRLEKEAQNECTDAEKFKTTAEKIKKEDESLSKWLVEKSEAYRSRGELQHRTIIDLDREWQRHSDRLELLRMDLEVTKALKEREDFIHQDYGEKVQAVCNHLADLRGRLDLGQGKLPSLQQVESLIGHFREVENLSTKRDRRLFSHIVTRLEEVHHLLCTN